MVLELIPGAGHHSKGGAVIKPKVIEELKRRKLDFSEKNAGTLLVTIEGAAGTGRSCAQQIIGSGFPHTLAVVSKYLLFVTLFQQVLFQLLCRLLQMQRSRQPLQPPHQGLNIVVVLSCKDLDPTTSFMPYLNHVSYCVLCLKIIEKIIFFAVELFIRKESRNICNH